MDLRLDVGRAHVLRNAGGRTSDDAIRSLVVWNVERSVEDDVAVIRSCGLLPHGITVWGAIYDVDTGGLRSVVDPGPAEDGASEVLHCGQQ